MSHFLQFGDFLNRCLVFCCNLWTGLAGSRVQVCIFIVWSRNHIEESFYNFLFCFSRCVLVDFNLRCCAIQMICTKNWCASVSKWPWQKQATETPKDRLGYRIPFCSRSNLVIVTFRSHLLWLGGNCDRPTDNLPTDRPGTLRDMMSR